MGTTAKPDDKTVLLKIQNSRKPDQIIELVLDRANGHFYTSGLKDLFGVKEIRVGAEDILQSLPEYAQVLSFLIETMSEAEELHLPYSYQNDFELGGMRYTLYDEGEFRVLKRVDEASAS